MDIERADYLLVGGGAAGAAAAEALRTLHPSGSVVLVSREADPPYYRPACSKELLRGEVERPETYLHPLEAWEEMGVDLRLRCPVLDLHPQTRTATLAGGRTLAFTKALIATGANVRRLQVPGGHLEGIHYVRTPGNAEAICRQAQGARRAVVIGGSFLGCEVAASLRQLGLDCSIIMPESAVLEAKLGAEVGERLQAILAEHDVRIYAGLTVAAFEGDSERVASVLTSGDERLEAELVVVAVGVLPDVMLAKKAGLALGQTGGVRANSRLESSTAGIYVAGDACEFEGEAGRQRVEHWQAARDQGVAAARNMTGADEPYRDVPAFWSEFADWSRLEFVGTAAHGARVVTRDVEGRAGAFAASYGDDGNVTAVLTVNAPGLIEAERRRIGYVT